MAEPILDGDLYYIDASGRYYANRSKTLGDGDALVFIGDSILNGLSVETVFRGVNYGISGEKVENAKEQILNYKNLGKKSIVIALGINDIPRKTEEIIADYELLLDRLPKSSFIIVSSVLPIDEPVYNASWGIKKSNDLVSELNNALARIAQSRMNTVFIDTSTYLRDPTGNLIAGFHSGDGIHLNAKGYMMWVKGLKEEFNKIVKQGLGGDALQRVAR
jgi:lysophospholipase L1-like esterase